MGENKDPAPSFVPRLALECERAGLGFGATRSQTIEAAALFSDITGFTALTASLTRRGRDGVEELTGILNDYFRLSLEVVRQYSGEPVKFAGDALLAIWPANGDPAGAVLAAAACALRMQEVLKGLVADRGLALHQRIAVTAGPTNLVCTGDPDAQRFFVVCGPSITQITSAMNEASSGEVVLSVEAAQLVSNWSKGRSRDDGTLRLEALANAPSAFFQPGQRDSELSPSIAEVYLPPPVRARLTAGQEQWLAERRHVSSMFINLVGFDHHNEGFGERFETILTAVQPELTRLECFIKEVTVDDKGASLVVHFGLPPASHEDDAARCVIAAMGVQRSLEALQQASSIGVATGPALAATIGDEGRWDYAVISESVNLAARLMTAAAGGILVDAATARASRSRVVFETVDSVALKGWKDEFNVSRPTGLVPVSAERLQRGARPSHALVGRFDEHARLMALLNQVGLGPSEAVLIEGDAGIGKSRLLTSVLEEAERLGLEALTGSGDSIAQYNAYFAWRPIFRQVLHISEGNPASDLGRSIDTLVPARPELVQLAPLLGNVLGVDVADTDETRNLTGETRADLTRNLLIRILEAAAGAQGSLVIVLDDVQWFDTASWQLTAAVSNELESTLVVLAARPMQGSLPSAITTMQDAGRLERIDLGPLDTSDVISVAADAIGATSLPDQVEGIVSLKSGGNPFFAQEILLALDQAGLVQVSEGKCSIAPGANLASLTLPETVEGLIASRIDRLSPQQQLMLKVSSVIGRSFTVRGLAEVYPLDADRANLPLHLDELARLGLTTTEEPAPSLTYSFRHSLVQEVAYGLLSLDQRRQLHGRTAVFLEAESELIGSTANPLLAHHYERAGETLKALQYLELSGDNYVYQGDFAEASAMFESALRLGEPSSAKGPLIESPRRAHWRRQLGECYYSLTQFDESEQQFSEALQLLGRPFPRSKARFGAEILRQLVFQFAWIAGRRSPPPRIDEGSLQASRIYERLSHLAYLRDQDLPTLTFALRMLREAQRSSPSSQLAKGYAGICVALSMVPLRGAATRYAQLAERTSAALDERDAWADAVLAVFYHCTGRWNEASSRAQAAADYFRALGQGRLVGRMMFDVTGVLLQVERRRGDPIHSLQVTEFHRAWSSDDPVLAAFGSMNMALNLLHTSGPESARAWAEDAVERSIEAGGRGSVNSFNAYASRAVLADVLCRQERFEEALVAAQEAERIIAGPDAGRWVANIGAGEALSSLASAYLNLSETDDTPEKGAPDMLAGARRAIQRLKQSAQIYPMWKPAYWRLMGLLEWQQGSSARANTCWRRAIAEAEALAMPQERALTLYEVARHGAPTEDSSAILEEAQSVLSQLGFAYESDLARAVLDQARAATRDYLARPTS